MGVGGLLGSLYWKITHDSSEFKKGVTDARKDATLLGKDFEEVGRSMTSVGKGMTMGITLPIIALGAAIIKSTSDMENYRTSFETMLGSAEKAQAFTAALQEMAAVTPFQFSDLADASKTLLQFGISAEKIKPIISSIGDVAQGNAQRFGQLSLAFGQMSSVGHLMGQDLLQMINAGFNPLNEIARTTGKSMGELKIEMAAGAITADMVTAAFSSATSQGGMFYEGMLKGSKTLSGQWSTLMDDAATLGRSFGEILLPVARDLIGGISGAIKAFSGLDDGTKKLILTIAGVAAVMGPAIAGIGGLITVFTTANPIVLGVCVALGAIAIASVAISNAMDVEHKIMNDLKINSEKYTKTLDELQKINILLTDKTKNLSAAERENLEIQKEALLIRKEQEALKIIAAYQDLDKLRKADNENIDANNKLIAQNTERLKNNTSGSVAFTAMIQRDLKDRQNQNIELKEHTVLLQADEIQIVKNLAGMVESGSIELAVIDKTNKALGELVATQIKLDALKPKEKTIIPGASIPPSEEFKPLDLTGFEKEFQTSMDLISDDSEETTDKVAEDWKIAAAKMKEETDKIFSYTASVGAAFGALIAGISNAQMQEIDNQMRAELEAAGVADDTAVESAEKKLAEAKKGGKAEEIAAAQTALKKAQIEEIYEKKKRKLAFDTAMLQWELNLALTLASAAQVMLNAWNSALFPANIPAMIMGGILSALQIGAVMAAKPVMPSAKEGAFLSGDAQIQAHANEVIFPLDTGIEKMVDKLVSKMMTMTARQGLASPDRIIHTQIFLDSKVLYDVMSKGSRSGELSIDQRAVV